MKVKYIHESSTGSLTKDKLYDVLRKNGDFTFEEYYVVIGDHGKETWDWCNRFDNISEIRNAKLNELLE